MASTLTIPLLLSASLFTVKAGIGEDVVSSISDDCTSYYTINRDYKEGFKCFFQHCCGNCDNKYCCSDERLKLTESVQRLCSVGNSDALIIVIGILGFLFQCFVIAICGWCIYKICRRLRHDSIQGCGRTVAGAQVTAVTNTNVIQQQSAVQGVQYPQYQPVPSQPGYGQPMQMTPYQGQPCAPGPPPSNNVATNPGYPTSQSAYDKGQAMYPMQPPVQLGPVYTPSDTSTQPAYNPADMQPPNTSY